jgi:hypothetical protein
MKRTPQYSIIVRDSDNKITDVRDHMSRNEAVKFMRTVMREMDYDEVTAQIQKALS